MNRHSIANSAWLVLALGLLIVPACNSSDGGMMTSGGSTVLLNYDGEQDASPNLTGNTTYEAAARFTPAETTGLVGATLTEVRFYIQTVPDNCKVKIYGEGTPTTPGALLYSADVTAGLAAASWNTHLLASSVTIPSGDIWISIEFTDTLTQPTIGCDPGPAVPNGNWLFNSSSGTWAPFVISVNWNVRGVVQLAS